MPSRLPELDQLALVEAGGSEAPLDVGLVVVGLGLGDPPQAVGVHGQEPQRRVIAASGTSEQLRDVQHGGVVLAGPVAWRWGGEAERLVDRLHQLQGHPAVGGELPVGAVQALGCLHHRRVQEREREGPPVDQRQDRLDREPRRRPRVQQPAAPDLRDSQSRFLTRQGAKVDQPPHEVLRDIRALGDLSDPVRHQDAASSHPHFIVAQPDAATARLRRAVHRRCPVAGGQELPTRRRRHSCERRSRRGPCQRFARNCATRNLTSPHDPTLDSAFHLLGCVGR